jgi:ferric-dicitrate binding protein FerR (iron transport regulator)
VSEQGTAPGDERVRQLLMSGLDGELSAEEREELERLLNADSRLREEWDRLSRVKEVTQSMALRKPPDEVWEDYWASVYSRLERGVGWILVSVGGIVLVSYGAWQGVQALIADTDMPWFLKGAILATTVGLVVLFVSVLREKLFVWTRDPYKDVQR